MRDERLMDMMPVLYDEIWVTFSTIIRLLVSKFQKGPSNRYPVELGYEHTKAIP